MDSSPTSLADDMDRPKGSADLTTAALYNLDCTCYNTLPKYLGSKMVEVVCGDAKHGRTGFLSCTFPQTFTIHRDLLCRYSRFFRQKLGLDLGSEIVADCLWKIEYDDAVKAEQGRKSTYLSFRHVPSGYVPSWVTFAEDYRRRAREISQSEVSDQARTSESQSEEIISLESESKDLFAIFVHWLYTQKLVLDDNPFATEEILCAHIYALAERLDVPALRQQCYQRLYDSCGENNRLPETGALEIIINQCAPTSLLHKYMVALIAHEIIVHGHQSKERCDPILALDKTFAAEVALEIMDRLRSDEPSADPYTEGLYEVDDSDSDFDSSLAFESDYELGSDANMTVSDGEEEESVAGDEPETSQTVAAAPPSSSELSQLSSLDLKNIPVVSGSPTADGGLPSVKFEAHAPDGHALSEVNGNKRKRPSQSFGDDEGRQNKRSESGIVEDVENIDLAQ